MKKLVISFLIIIICIGCKLDYDSGLMMEFDIPDLEFEEYTVESILFYIGMRTKYVDDVDAHNETEYWQNPYQTWTLQTGDCEDIVILDMYLIYRDLEIVSKLSIMKVYYLKEYLGRHACIRVNGVDYDAGHARRCDQMINYIFRCVGIIEYSEAIYRSVYGHKCIKE